jgi:hypothetical protein
LNAFDGANYRSRERQCQQSQTAWRAIVAIAAAAKLMRAEVEAVSGGPMSRVKRSRNGLPMRRPRSPRKRTGVRLGQLRAGNRPAALRRRPTIRPKKPINTGRLADARRASNRGGGFTRAGMPLATVGWRVGRHDITREVRHHLLRVVPAKSRCLHRPSPLPRLAALAAWAIASFCQAA